MPQRTCTFRVIPDGREYGIKHVEFDGEVWLTNKGLTLNQARSIIEERRAARTAAMKDLRAKGFKDTLPVDGIVWLGEVWETKYEEAKL